MKGGLNQDIGYFEAEQPYQPPAPQPYQPPPGQPPGYGPPPGAPPGVPPGAPPLAPMAPAPKKMTTGAIIALVGGLLMLIGTFLPWATVKSDIEEITVIGLLSGFGGILVLIMGILAIVGAAIKKPILSTIFGVIGLIFSGLAFILISALESLAKTTTGGEVTVEVNYGIYISLIGCVLALIGGIVGHIQMK